MLKQASKNNLLSRYNKAIVLVFLFIILSASTVAYVRYFNELKHHENKALKTLTQQANTLNTMLEQSVQAISGMQGFANYYLKHPEELSARMPKFLQDGELYYLDKPKRDVVGLDKRLSGNITGYGDISTFTLEKIEELAMANALTPAFISAKLTIPEANWFYYVSSNRFVNIYPWVDRESWHYSDITLNNDYIKSITSVNDDFWSPPYIDSAGSGLNTSLSVGVYRQDVFVGAVVIDFNLMRLYNSLPDSQSANHGLVLLNKKHRVLVDKKAIKTKLTPNTQWQEVFPDSLKNISMEQLLQLPNSVEIEGWLIQKHRLPVNGWILFQYQPYAEFSAPIFNDFMFVSAVFFVGLVAFLGLVYLLTHRTFIHPTADFINHIENCSQGDPGKIKPAAGWLHWFNIVEDIFSQNRSLLQQLKEQNSILDRRVSEKTQALLKSSEQHQQDYALLGSVMNAMPELIIFNDLHGKLSGCNLAFEQFIKKGKTTILGTDVSPLMPQVLGRVLIEMSSLSVSNNCEHQRIVETDAYTYDVFSRQFFNERGVSLGTINIFRDVSEQFTIQSALKRAKNQAEYANKAKSQFLANMSHEIRTPINAMQGMMELLNKTAINSHQLHYLQNAQRASGSLLHLIDELLDLSKIEAGKMFINMESVNVDLILEKALKLNIATVKQADLNLIIDIDPSVPKNVITDEVRLVQVLTNLLNNAVKFTHQGEIKLLVELTAKRENNTLVRFTVKDTGIGIAKDKQNFLFDAFTQADTSMTREYGGSGLGLSICQQIINLLGGEITVKSELGQGSEFSFVIPFVTHQLTDQVALPKAAQDNSPIEHYYICSLGFEFLPHLVESCVLQGSEYRSINAIEEIEQLPNNKKIVLLIDSEYIGKAGGDLLKNINDKYQRQVILVGLCQPVMTIICDEIVKVLSTLSMPYLLLDMPLYRYSLGEITKMLVPTVANKINLQKTDPQQKVLIEEKQNLAGKNILLVEDNLVNQLVAKELLKNMQAKVIIAENGKIALELLKDIEENKDENIDVILMDIQMPIMDGLTATRLIRENPKYKNLPIIAMTAHARVEDKESSFKAGMNLHIAKPVSAELLLNSIQQSLAK